MIKQSNIFAENTKIDSLVEICSAYKQAGQYPIDAFRDNKYKVLLVFGATAYIVSNFKPIGNVNPIKHPILKFLNPLLDYGVQIESATNECFIAHSAKFPSVELYIYEARKDELSENIYW